MKLVIIRKYDKDNRLILDKRNSMSYSVKYGNNTINYKEWNHSNGEIISDITEEYDENGNMIHYSDPENLNEYWCKYDKDNRLIEKFDKDGSIIYNYDERGNLLNEIDSEDSYSIRYINIYNQVIPDIKLDDNTIIKSYDENNNLLEEISSYYHNQYKYDKNGNNIYYTNLENQEKYYKYDENNNLIYISEKNNIIDNESIYFNNKKIMCKTKDNIYLYLYDSHGNIQYKIDKFGNIEVEYINEYED